MVPAPFRVVLDANVLYPFTLRDTLLRAAAADLFQVFWSEQILDETTRNLVGNGVMTTEQAARLREAMSKAFPEALVIGHDSLIPAMPNQAKDRHVTAAALKAGAQVVVTCNLADFRDLPHGVEAQHPDEFLCCLLDLAPETLVEIVQAQSGDLRRPPRTFEDVLGALRRIVPEFVDALGAEVAGTR